MKLTIVVPAHNEEANIAGLIDKVAQIKDIDFELIVVIDHCSDDTGKIIVQKMQSFSNLRMVENKSDPGFANALKAGFSNATGDFIIPVMGDLCDDLTTMSLMWRKAKEGYDVVCASRYMQGGLRLGGSKFKSFLSASGGRSLYYILRVPTHDIANAFKMYRRTVIENMDIQAKGFEISMEMPLKAYYAGCKITEVPTIWRERTQGKSSFKVFKLLPAYLKLYIWAIYKSFTKKRAQ